MAKQVNNDILDAIEIMVDGKLKRQKNDQTVTGIIKEIIDNGYRVEIYGSSYFIKETITYLINDKVWVTIPCGDYDDMFIVRKKL